MDNFPMTVFSATFANEKPHFLQLRDVSLESMKFNVQLLRQFTCRNSRICLDFKQYNLMNIS